MQAADLAARLRERFPDVLEARGEVTLVVEAAALRETLEHLRTEPDLACEALSDLTVTDWPETAESETGRETAVVDSRPLELLALNEIVGGGSSSLIMAVTCCVPDSVPFVTAEISTTMVSAASFNVSCTAVSVIEPVVLPGGITIELPERV